MMATQGNGRLFSIFAAFSLFKVAVCYSADTPKTFGFELGNGTQIFIKHDGANTEMIRRGWDAQFREMVAPFLDSAQQRTSLKIIVTKASDILTFGDLARKFNYKSGWKLGSIGKYHSIEKEAQVKENHCMFDARIIKSPGEVIMFSVDGGPDCREGSDFDRVKSSLETFTLLE